MRKFWVTSAMLPMAGAGVFGRTTMKWITREHPRVDRVACPWLIGRFVDKQAEFLYVPSDQVAAEAQKRGATPYDIKDVELGHHGPECSFDAFVHKYGLDKDPAMAYMAKVIRGADTADKTITPESQGVEAILDGIRHVHYPNDQKQREASRPLLDALYAFCQKKVEAKARDPAARWLHARAARSQDRKSTRLNSSHTVISYA